jgi:hypothetical protein
LFAVLFTICEEHLQGSGAIDIVHLFTVAVHDTHSLLLRSLVI